MDIAKGLISSLIHVALSPHMPFCQRQQLQHLHHSFPLLSFVLSFLSSLLHRWRFVICALYGFSARFCKWRASRNSSYTILCLECYPKYSNSWKWSVIEWTTTIWLISGRCTLTIKNSTFSVNGWIYCRDALPAALHSVMGWKSENTQHTGKQIFCKLIIGCTPRQKCRRYALVIRKNW